MRIWELCDDWLKGYKKENESYLIKENLSFAKNMFEFCQLKEVPFKGFGILIDFF